MFGLVVALFLLDPVAQVRFPEEANSRALHKKLLLLGIEPGSPDPKGTMLPLDQTYRYDLMRKKEMYISCHTEVFSLAGREEASDRVLKSIGILTSIGIPKQLQRLF